VCVLTELGKAAKSKPWATVEELSRNNLAALAAQFGWDLDAATGEPLRPAIVVGDLAGLATMAAVMCAAGAFTSVGEAKRNGWNRPVESGTFFVGKGPNKRTVVVP
jgi:hypothetical protein